MGRDRYHVTLTLVVTGIKLESHVDMIESLTCSSSHIMSHSHLIAKIGRGLWRNLAGRQCFISQSSRLALAWILKHCNPGTRNCNSICVSVLEQSQTKMKTATVSGQSFDQGNQVQ